MGRVTRIILEGRRRGVLRLTETEDGVMAETSMSGAETVACISEAEGRTAFLVNGRAKLKIKDVRAAAVGAGGRLIAAGFSGALNGQRARFFERLRLLIAGSMEKEKVPRSAQVGEKEAPSEPVRENKKAPAQENKTAAAPSAPAQAPAAPVPSRTLGSVSPRSAVSESVLEMARLLFGGLDAGGDDPPNSFSPSEKAAEPSPKQPFAIAPERAQNPFPRMFPRSEWVRRGEELTGDFSQNGERFIIKAIPASPKGGAAGTENGLIWARSVPGRDGRAYFVEVRRKGKNP